MKQGELLFHAPITAAFAFEQYFTEGLGWTLDVGPPAVWTPMNGAIGSTISPDQMAIFILNFTVVELGNT